MAMQFYPTISSTISLDELMLEVFADNLCMMTIISILWLIIIQ